MNDLVRRPITILIADDDPDDRQMIKEAFDASCLSTDVRFVEDGVELINYLKRQDDFATPDRSPRPGLILLDLNMPRKDGWEALAEIKADPALRMIPVLVLTTSKADHDVLRSYELAASSYITKPVSFHDLMETIQSLGKYWFEIVQLPQDHDVKNHA